MVPIIPVYNIFICHDELLYAISETFQSPNNHKPFIIFEYNKTFQMLRFILAFNKHILSTIIHFFVFQMLCVWVDPIYQSGQQKARVSTYRTYVLYSNCDIT